jgi:hypothetical protein
LVILNNRSINSPITYSFNESIGGRNDEDINFNHRHTNKEESFAEEVRNLRKEIYNLSLNRNSGKAFLMKLFNTS